MGAPPRLIWLDGFELSDPPLAFWQSRYNTVATLLTDTGRNGTGRAVRYASVGSVTLTIPFSGVVPTPIIGFGFKFNEANTDTLVRYQRLGVDTFALKFIRDSGTTGHLQVLAGATVLGEMSVGDLVADRWYYIELQAAVTNTGLYELRVDKMPVLAGAPVDTQGAASAGVDALTINFSCASVAGGISLDDLYFGFTGTLPTTSFLGPISVQPLQPVSAHTAQYSPVSGSSNVAMVADTAPDADATYNVNAAGTKKDLFSMTPRNVEAVSAEYCGVMGVFIHRVDGGSITFETVHYDELNGTEQVYTSAAFSATAYTNAYISLNNFARDFEAQDVVDLHFGYRSI